MEEPVITASVELLLAGGSLSGHLTSEAGRLDFTGWLGLIAAIDGLLDPDPQKETP